MNKKEMKIQAKLQEEEQRKMISLRKQLINEMENYEEDVQATIRYYKTHGLQDKICGGGLFKEEQEELAKRYPLYYEEVKEYFSDKKARCLDGVYAIHYTEKKKWEDYDYTFETKLEENDLYWSDIIWSKEYMEIIINAAKKFGYKRIQYFNESSGAMENLYTLIEMGARIVGKNAVLRKSYNWKKEDEPEKTYIIDRHGLIIEI